MSEEAEHSCSRCYRPATRRLDYAVPRPGRAVAPCTVFACEVHVQDVRGSVEPYAVRPAATTLLQDEPRPAAVATLLAAMGGPGAVPPGASDEQVVRAAAATIRFYADVVSRLDDSLVRHEIEAQRRRLTGADEWDRANAQSANRGGCG